MPTCPPTYSDVPAVAPYGHGLFSVAITPDEVPDHVECGVEFEPLSCQKAFTTHDPCNPADGQAAPADKVIPRGVPLVEATPFTVYAGFECTLVGRSLADVQRRAEAALELGEQRAVEFAYWTGSEGNRPRLADADAVQVAGGTDGVSPKAALAALEDYLGREYGGRGVIHAPRGMASYWHDHIHATDEARWNTALGTRLAFGGGYSSANTGPDGAVAPAGKAWAYATGQVYLWRSAAWFNPQPIEQALDKRTNTVSLMAERTYVVAHECVLAAALIDLNCCPC